MKKTQISLSLTFLSLVAPDVIDENFGIFFTEKNHKKQIGHFFSSDLRVLVRVFLLSDPGLIISSRFFTVFIQTPPIEGMNITSVDKYSSKVEDTFLLHIQYIQYIQYIYIRDPTLPPFSFPLLSFHFFSCYYDVTIWRFSFVDDFFFFFFFFFCFTSVQGSTLRFSSCFRCCIKKGKNY